MTGKSLKPGGAMMSLAKAGSLEIKNGSMKANGTCRKLLRK